MLIEGNVVWLDFIRIWAPMFGCRRTRLHSPQSELFPVEEIVFPFAILFLTPDLFSTIFIHGSFGFWSDSWRVYHNYPKFASQSIWVSFPGLILSAFQSIHVWPLSENLRSNTPLEISICAWYMTLLHFLVMYIAVSDRVKLCLFYCHASQFDFKVVSILGFFFFSKKKTP